MTCPICKNGKTLDGFTTLVFEKGKSTIIVKKIPAEVCENCNESFISENTSKKLLDVVSTEVKKGIEVEILNFAA